MRHAVVSMNFSIAVQPYNDFYCAGRHTHDCVEIKYVVSGRGTHVIDGYSLPVSAGDIFFVGLSASHYVQCEKEHPVMVYNLNVRPETFSEIFGEDSSLDKSLFDKPYLALRDSQGQVQKILEEMHTEYIGREAGWTETLRAGLLRVLVYIARNAGEKREEIAKSTDPIFNVVSYIDRHYSEAVSLDTLADLAGYNPSYLSRRFKQVMGVGINEYIHKVRVTRACVYLRESDKSFSWIAYRVGYENENFFRNVFRRMIGKNPREFRLESRQAAGKKIE